MSEPVYDKHGIRIFPDVARLDPYAEATIKRFPLSMKKTAKRSELEVLSDRYFMQGALFLNAINHEIGKVPPDGRIIARLLRKAAVAFDESFDIDSYTDLNRSEDK